MIVAIIGYFIIGPVMTVILSVLSAGVAIPHGTSEAKDSVKKTGIVLVQYPDGVDFGTVGINFKKRGVSYDLYSNI